LPRVTLAGMGMVMGASPRGRPVLGVFGGAFDPPHLGHAMVPAYLRLRGLAERVLVVPCVDHPLGKDLSPLPRRMALTRAAMATHGDAVEVSDIEARLYAAHGGPSYTLRMLEAVAQAHPDHVVRLVVGSDIAEQVERWHRWEEIERRFSPIVVPRTGHAPPEVCALPAVSSTQVRAWLERVRGEDGPDRAAAELGLATALPEAVLQLLQAAEGAPVWVVGRGHVATHAVPWLEGQGRAVVWLPARALVAGTVARPEGVPAGVWVLARDPALPMVAQALAGLGLPSSVPVLHAAGAWRAGDALRPLSKRGHPVGTLHPICSLRAERPWPSPLSGAAFGVEGDPAARALALAWVGSQPWLELAPLDAAARRAYHAACSLAANHLAVPYAAARDVLVAQGHPAPAVEAALGGLMRSALANLLVLGVPAGVTGPVARGDAMAVQAHRDALPSDAAALYGALSERLATIVARARG
jgi:nicotinate (nicotinamide) nucleotide adenylyltransferase